MVREFLDQASGDWEGAQSALATVTSEHDSVDWERASPKTQSCGCNAKICGENSAWETCAEDPKVFLNALKVGRIRGVACILGLGEVLREQGPVHVPLVRELIKRDILVIVSDCTTVGLGDAGLLGQDGYAVAGQGLVEFCDYLDVEPILNIGDCVERVRLTDFCTTLAEQVGLQASDLPFVTIANGQLLQEREGLDMLSFAHCLDAGHDMDSAVATNVIDAHIHAKRLKLAWCDQCHCSIHS
nr:hypothetical protein [uncultured Desulfobulbus sp.]